MRKILRINSRSILRHKDLFRFNITVGIDISNCILGTYYIRDMCRTCEKTRIAIKNFNKITLLKIKLDKLVNRTNLKIMRIWPKTTKTDRRNPLVKYFVNINISTCLVIATLKNLIGIHKDFVTSFLF